MNFPDGLGSQTEPRVCALDAGWRPETETMTDSERQAVLSAGIGFANHAGGIWILLSGRFISDRRSARGTEGQVRDMLRRVFGYPNPDDSHEERKINILLDSPGGSLDSTYITMLYLSNYSRNISVFVPNRAKSASTLIAIGGNELHLSAFGEIGPLDTQINDPRNAAKHASALDCYQSVDYVRNFGIRTTIEILEKLITGTDRRIPALDLLDNSREFAISAISPMLEKVSALDFGGWGRSLRIGESYATRLLEMHGDDVDHGGDHAWAQKTAKQLVFEYTHHLFPIDYREAQKLKLPVTLMDEETYCRASRVIDLCDGKVYVGFISEDEQRIEDEAARREESEYRHKKVCPEPSESHAQAMDPW